MTTTKEAVEVLIEEMMPTCLAFTILTFDNNLLTIFRCADCGAGVIDRQMHWLYHEQLKQG